MSFLEKQTNKKTPTKQTNRKPQQNKGPLCEFSDTINSFSCIYYLDMWKSYMQVTCKSYCFSFAIQICLSSKLSTVRFPSTNKEYSRDKNNFPAAYINFLIITLSSSVQHQSFIRNLTVLLRILVTSSLSKVFCHFLGSGGWLLMTSQLKALI